MPQNSSIVHNCSVLVEAETNHDNSSSVFIHDMQGLLCDSKLFYIFFVSSSFSYDFECRLFLMF